MSSFLLVPMRVNALFVPKPQMVVGPPANFSRLPYTKNQIDHNSATPNISEAIVRQSFQDQTFFLEAGVHLHWILPAALRRTLPAKTNQAQRFPTLPNRWLISRSVAGQGSAQWILESDYLYPSGEGEFSGSICYPYSQNLMSGNLEGYGRGEVPFRYLGRSYLFTEWQSMSTQGDYLGADLTAIGYGDPTFAAFYPSCHSVFGFYDSQSDLTSLEYEVLGWYSNPKLDILSQLDFTTISDLQTYLKWQWESSKDSSDSPSQTVYYGQVVFSAQAQTQLSPPSTPVQVTVGNTAPEALCAYLAQTVQTGEDAQQLEYELEAIDWRSGQGDSPLDFGARFQQELHTKGFNASSGGTQWIVVPATSSSAQGSSAPTVPPQGVTLPDPIADLLNELNLKQQAYDQGKWAIVSQQQQLFADWYKYMLCKYPPSDLLNTYPDVDLVKYFIQQRDLQPLHNAVKNQGQLAWQTNSTTGGVTTACDQTHTSGSLAQQTAEVITHLLAAFQKYAQENHQSLVLKPIPGPRFWQPNEPVLLLTGAGLPAAAESNSGTNAFIFQLGQFEEAGQSPELLIRTMMANLQQPLPSVSSPTVAVAWLNASIAPYEIFSQDMSAKQLGQAGEQLLKQILKNYQVKKFSDLSSTQLTQLAQEGAGQQLKRMILERAYPQLTPPNTVYLNCTLLSNTNWGTQTVSSLVKNGQVAGLLNQVNTWLSAQKQSPAVNQWQQQPWQPFILEWEVEFFPMAQENNLHPESQEYAATYIQNHYQLLENQCEVSLDPKAGPVQVQPAANVYKGQSLLTPRSDLIQTLQQQLQAYQNNPSAKSIPELSSVLSQLKGLHCLAQCLSGFNEALLMHQQIFQLPVTDPLAFADYLAFTVAVHQAVGRQNTNAPLPWNNFNPMATGALQFLRLRLVDAFGRTQDLPVTGVQKTCSLQPPKNIIGAELSEASLAWLPPRLMQSTQLNFRWLSAQNDLQEMNVHPAASPICGWVVPNNLNGSLMIYATTGEALGSIAQNAQWYSTPGASDPVTSAAQIKNPHLQNFVTYLQNQGSSFLNNFLSAVDSALENIHPTNTLQSQALALLMGRPLALVRASAQFQLQGQPVINEGWNQLILDMSRADGLRTIDEFTRVRLPIRIGEFAQLNDGVVGYFLENAKGDYQDEIFYAVQSSLASFGKKIVSHAQNPLWRSVQDPTQNLTLLIDPQGEVHATSGVLPTKSIYVPPDQYQTALKQMQVSFRTTPVLMPQGQTVWSSPTEPGYQWQWVQNVNGKWTATKDLTAFQSYLNFPPNMEIRDGWMQLVPLTNKSPNKNGAPKQEKTS